MGATYAGKFDTRFFLFYSAPCSVTLPCNAETTLVRPPYSAETPFCNAKGSMRWCYATHPAFLFRM